MHAQNCLSNVAKFSACQTTCVFSKNLVGLYNDYTNKDRKYLLFAMDISLPNQSPYILVEKSLHGFILYLLRTLLNKRLNIKIVLIVLLYNIYTESHGNTESTSLVDDTMVYTCYVFFFHLLNNVLICVRTHQKMSSLSHRSRGSHQIGEH